MNKESPICNDGWNFATHGIDWECKCIEGSLQSPINLPDTADLEDVKAESLFIFNELDANTVLFVWEENMMKMKGEFGSITDPTGAEYIGYELRFHTPSEHTIQGKRFDLEVQVLYKGVTEGDFFKQAGLSFMFSGKAGASNRFFDALDMMNLPDTVRKSVEVTSNVNVQHILFEDDHDFADPNFNYYAYQGSITNPPCSEHMTWFIAADVKKISTTQLTMFSDSLTATVAKG